MNKELLESVIELVALLVVTAIEAWILSLAFPATFTYLQAFVVVYVFQVICGIFKKD